MRDALIEGCEIVTANRRLSRVLRGSFEQQQIAAGKLAWQTPAIWSWHDWLSVQLSRVTDPSTIPTVLGSASCHVLWEQSLLRHVPDGVPGFSALVRNAVQSWQRLREWQLPLGDLQTSARSQDERVFAAAAADFVRQLADGNWVDIAGIADLVAALFQNHKLNAPRGVLLAGFDRLNPAIQSMIAVLEGAECKVRFSPANEQSAKVSTTSFENSEVELRAAGAWARAILENSPRAKVAIVSPSLQSDAPATVRLVREGLVPGWQYGGDEAAAAANVSYGQKLSDFPAIAIALLLLRWTHRDLSSRELSILLRSQSVASERVDGRCRVDLALRQQADRVWQPVEFLKVFRGIDESPDTAVFFECVREIETFRQTYQGVANPAEWAHRLDALLTATKWIGEATLESVEFQLINRWRELLNEFSRIGAVSPLVSLETAVQRIATLASEALYQAESDRAQVEILGVLEASGMDFDCIWISGLDADQWPPQARPALFISKALQRQHEMPDCTPANTLTYARGILERLVASADDCVLSWATTRNELELAASSLLDPFPENGQRVFSDPGWFADALVGQTDIVEDGEDEAPPVGPDEKVRGGAYTVQMHHIEPFRAFVHGRLGVRPLEPIATGLSPSVRGNIIHSALHTLYAGKPARRAIAEWTAQETDERIGAAIDSALAEYLIHASPVMSRIFGLERERLRTMLWEFVGTELERPDFFVADVEKSIEFEAYGVRLGLRIDRIDRLANGSCVIIDYKTGMPKNFLDQDGAPTQLQLSVYACAIESNVGALALMNVDSKAIAVKGAGIEGGPWKPRDEVEWYATLDDWRSDVMHLLREFSAGDVRVNLLQSASEGRFLNILSRKEELRRAR